MKTFLFDFDGTLVDSMPAYIDVMLRLLNEKNIAFDNDLVKIITPLGYEKTAEYYIENLGLDMSKDETIAYMKDNALNEYMYNIPAKKNVIEVLNKLKESGAELNILTASPHIVLDCCLKRLGIYDLFTNIWSCEDFKTTKADTHIYEMAAEKIGKSIGEILFLDDNPDACRTAKKTGIKVCGVYDDSSKEYVEEIKETTDYYIYDFSELENMDV